MNDKSMSAQPDKVGLVVDPEFGERMRDLANCYLLWVVESPVNSAVCRSIWSTTEEVPDRGVSSFRPKEGETPEEMCVAILDTLDVHHSGYGATARWTEIEVWGASPTESLREAFLDYDVFAFVDTQEGFRCLRSDTESE